MEIGMVGLGKMGANMARRLMRGGHKVIGFDPRGEVVQELGTEGLIAAKSIKDLVQKAETPRAVWLMVPAGEITERTIRELSQILSSGDTVIDGGNSNYQDSVRRAKELTEQGIQFVDVGTSGGVWGLKEGYSMMIGGEGQTIGRLRPIFETLAPSPEQGWGAVGPSGAGHFVKMIHNGIEYGLMQAYAEGFEILKAKEEFDLDLHQVAEIWRFGSVIRSWLLDLTANALAANQELSDIEAWVPDSGEGRWTVFEAIDLDIAAPIITLALQRRLRSRSKAPFSDKLLAAMRNQFGGHAVKRVEKKS